MGEGKGGRFPKVPKTEKEPGLDSGLRNKHLEPDQQSGSLKSIEEQSAAFVMTSANG